MAQRKVPKAETNGHDRLSVEEFLPPLLSSPANKVKSKSVEWIWPDFIARGMIHLLEGRKATGKSTIASALASHVTGSGILGDNLGKRSSAVLWAAGEESILLSTVPRLKVSGAKLAKVHFLCHDAQGRKFGRLELPTMLERLERTIYQLDASLLIIDPLSSACSPSFDLRQEQQARAILDPLSAMAERMGVAVLLIRHLRKGEGGPALDQGLGGVAVGNASRVVLRCDTHPDRKEEFILSCVATNLSKKRVSVSFKIIEEKGSVRYEQIGDCSIDADQLAEGFGDGGSRDARADAKNLLSVKLSAGWVLASECMQEAKQAGISESTLRSAKAEMQIPSRRVCRNETSCWEWGPPEGGFKLST